MSERVEGKTGEPEPQLTLAEEVVNAAEQLNHFELATQAGKLIKSGLIESARKRVLAEGIPEGAELEAGVLLAASNYPELGQGYNTLRVLTRLTAISEGLTKNPGHLIAWLSDEEIEVVTAQPKTESDSTLIPQRLNLGVLPSNSKIEINKEGGFFFAVNQHVAIKLAFAVPGQEVNFDRKNVLPVFGLSEQRVVREPRQIELTIPELLRSRDFIRIGNDEVWEMIYGNRLEDDPYIYFAANELLESFRVSRTPEPELPPAA